MSFVRFRNSSVSLFNISIITATVSSIESGCHKLTALKEVCISFGDIFHSFASSNEDKFKLRVFFYLR